MSDDLKIRLVSSQEKLSEALDVPDYACAAAILEERAADIAALVEHVQSHPNERGWARDFLDRDRDLSARLKAASVTYQARVEDSRKARQVHRAYLSEGSRS